MDKEINILESIKTAEFVLIGIGEKASFEKDDYNHIKDIFWNKDYFVVSIEEDDTILGSELDKARISRPNDENCDPQKWEDYLGWLSHTLNHNLLIMELGVSLNAPGIIRFPFEKTCFYNKKAKMIRVNESIYQIPEEISEKGFGIKCSCPDFLTQLWNDFQCDKID